MSHDGGVKRRRRRLQELCSRDDGERRFREDEIRYNFLEALIVV